MRQFNTHLDLHAREPPGLRIFRACSEQSDHGAATSASEGI
jgi:hypothetical protein